MSREPLGNSGVVKSEVLGKPFVDMIDVTDAHCRRAREALTALTARDKPMGETELLIGDIAEILLDPDVLVGEPPRQIDTGNFVFSGDLLTLLRERFPHRTIYEAGFTQAKLASMLSTFDIETNQQRRGKQVLRAYRRSDFDDPIARYAPDVVAAHADATAGPVTPQPEGPESSGVAPFETDTVEATASIPPVDATLLQGRWRPLIRTPMWPNRLTKVASEPDGDGRNDPDSVLI